MELVDAEMGPLVSTVDAARKTPSRGQAPEIPPQAISFLDDLKDVLLAWHYVRISSALRACSTNSNAWRALHFAEWFFDICRSILIALRLVDHRFSWMARACALWDLIASGHRRVVVLAIMPASCLLYASFLFTR